MKINAFAVKILNLKNSLTLLLSLAALTSNAQYKLLTRGEPNPFDSAVAVELHRYRAEGLKLQLGQALVDSLVREIYSVHAELTIAGRIHAIDSLSITALEKSNARKDSVNMVVANNFQAVVNKATEKPKFWKDPKIWILTFALIDLLLHITQ